MRPLLRIQNLGVSFVTEGKTTTALHDVSFDISRGEILALVGESGSGKSVTSLSILKLLPQPPAIYTGGSIIFSPDGEETTDLLKANFRELQHTRGNRISMIFQEPMTSLNPVMSCGRQVMESLLFHKKISVTAAKRKVIEWFEKVRLPQPAQVFNRFPHQLSGGQKQRVMIAMAMCCEPALLICDEPTTALDVTVQKTILDLIKELQREQDMGVLFITHDLGVVKQIADRVVIMYKGSIVEAKGKQEIFSHPEHNYTKALIACRPSLHPKGEKLPVVSDFLEGKRTEPETAAVHHSGSGEVLVDVQHLVVKFAGRKNLFGKGSDFVRAVDDVSFQIFRGETLGLVGESGCGKTTLGRALLNLVQPDEGKILYKSSDINSISNSGASELRKEVQLIFQDPYSSLNPRLTIGNAISEPMKISGIEPNAGRRRKKVEELLDKVNLLPSMAQRYPHEFSGGQRQRIVIARALALNPDFIVCDESVSALDVSVQAQVLNLLNDIKKDLGLTILFISHDLSVVKYMSDRIMVMHKGKIVESGKADDVYDRPAQEYTRKLIEAIPSLSS